VFFLPSDHLRELATKEEVMNRDYRSEYDKYQGKPEQIKNRAQRNAARAKLAKAGKVHKGDGKDVAHVKAIDKGGAIKNGLRVESKAANRSFKRDSKGNLVSEISARERKKK
jgi:hypothetical protein